MEKLHTPKAKSNRRESRRQAKIMHHSDMRTWDSCLPVTTYLDFAMSVKLKITLRFQKLKSNKMERQNIQNGFFGVVLNCGYNMY
jgi:hypothetical protein